MSQETGIAPATARNQAGRVRPGRAPESKRPGFMMTAVMLAVLVTPFCVGGQMAATPAAPATRGPRSSIRTTAATRSTTSGSRATTRASVAATQTRARHSHSKTWRRFECGQVTREPDTLRSPQESPRLPLRSPWRAGTTRRPGRSRPPTALGCSGSPHSAPDWATSLAVPRSTGPASTRMRVAPSGWTPCCCLPESVCTSA